MENLPASRSEKNSRYLTAVLILLVGTVAIYFRFFDLRHYPGWYSDEGNHIDLAENWMQGEWRNYGVLGAPYSQRPPLYMYTVATAMSIFGTDITVSRGVCAVASLFTIALTALIAWKALGRKEGILTFCMGAVAPWIVVFGRLGLTYNLMGFFFLFSLLALWYYLKTASAYWLAGSAVSAALAFATDYLGIFCGITIGVAILVCHPRSIIRFVAIYLLVLVICFIPVVLVNSKIFFLDTWNTIFWRGVVQSTSSSLISILINYSELLRRESWILIGLCGLFLIKDDPLRNILLTAVGLSLLVVTRAYTPVGVGLHYLMHLFPIFALGLAVFMLRAYETLKVLFNGQLSTLTLRISTSRNSAEICSANSRISKASSFVSALLAAMIVFTPLAWMFLSSFAMVTYKTDYIFTGNDDLRLVEVNSANQVREFLSTHTTPDDLVIGSPVLIWGLPTMNRADFLAALAYNGYKPNNYIDVDKMRYRNELTMERATFIVLDPLAEEFAPLVLPGMNLWLEKIHTWPVVFEAGNIRVYQR